MVLANCPAHRASAIRKSHKTRKKEGRVIMKLYDKRFRRWVSALILVIIVAMVATMVIPYLI